MQICPLNPLNPKPLSPEPLSLNAHPPPQVALAAQAVEQRAPRLQKLEIKEAEARLAAQPILWSLLNSPWDI